MSSVKQRGRNIHELNRRICNLADGNGEYMPDDLEMLINKFCLEKNITRRKANEYIKLLKGAGLLKIE